ncbi:MAG: hypothetical protein GY782_01410 [Gammaproteobacteria bacterium]|nr:hypothetical protein [Gammaproteobacteria bacterium]
MKNEQTERVMSELLLKMVDGLTEGMDLKQMAAFRTSFDGKGLVVEGVTHGELYTIRK